MKGIICLTFFVTWSLAQSAEYHHRARRSTELFTSHITCVGRRNPSEYVGYGCWCGTGNAGTQVTLDEIDDCCKTHRQDYDKLKAVGGACENAIYPLTLTSYRRTCARLPKLGRCNDLLVSCERHLCDVDLKAAVCFAQNDGVYNPEIYVGEINNLKKIWPDQCFHKTCTVKGDPHWKTFDGKHFNFQGTCKYNLASYSGNEADEFKIMAKMRSLGKHSTMTDYIEIHFGGNVVTLEQHAKVTVNDEEVSLDYSDPSSTFEIKRSGPFMVFTTTSGLRVAFTGNAYALINIPAVYETLSQGICGNFDGNAGNDLLKKDGIAGPPCEVGVSWAEPDPGCSFTCN